MQPDREADRLSASIVEVKYEWSCTSVPSICRHGMHRYDLSFTIFKLPIIQGNSEGTVNVSGGYSIRQCDINSSYGS